MSDDDRKCKVAGYAFIVDPPWPADDLLTVDDVSIGIRESRLRCGGKEDGGLLSDTPPAGL